MAVKTILHWLMKTTNFVERMKTKNFYVVIALLVISSCTIWLLNSPSPTFRSIVNKTQKGIKNLPNNIQMKSNHEMTVNPLYLSRLRLDTSASIPAGGRSNRPVVATAVGRESWDIVSTFMDSVAQHMPNNPVVVFDLSSSDATHVILQKNCNWTTKCEVRKFKFEEYPSHVADLSIKSYRPICIQEMLNRYGWVIWADPVQYFQLSNISATLQQVEDVGLAAWTIEDPTSAITHPKMFDFFETKKDLYYFQHAVESSHIIIYGTPVVRQKIMLPWVKCALLEECINPTGAQNVGCNFMRKPLFKYSGCHYYDMSALNIILGRMFEYNEHAYAAREEVFGNFLEDQLAAQNVSDPLHRSRLKLREYLNGRLGKVSK